LNAGGVGKDRDQYLALGSMTVEVLSTVISTVESFNLQNSSCYGRPAS